MLMRARARVCEEKWKPSYMEEHGTARRWRTEFTDQKEDDDDEDDKRAVERNVLALLCNPTHKYLTPRTRFRARACSGN